MNNVDIKVLLGKTLTSIIGGKGSTAVDFLTSTGEKYRFYHKQDCCESVEVEDICGNLADLIGSPITQADEETNEKDPEGYEREYPPESVTWTFYRFATAKGQVVIRWLGESNGYYSEKVYFEQIK